MTRQDIKQRRAQRRALAFKFDKPAGKYQTTLARAAVKLAPVEYNEGLVIVHNTLRRNS